MAATLPARCGRPDPHGAHRTGGRWCAGNCDIVTALERDALYPLGDAVPLPGPHRDYRARMTGEYRPPLAGDWYLSGAIITAYRAAADLSQPFYIARLVRAMRVQTWEEIAP
jgi:hypothetical protein